MTPSSSTGTGAGAGQPSRLVAFARVLAGVLRPRALLDRLLAEVSATFAPEASAACSLDEQGAEESASGDLASPGLRDLLDQVLRAAATVEADGAVAVPIFGRHTVRGAVALRNPAGGTAAALPILEELAAVAGVALEAASLAEAVERRSRGWEAATEALHLALAVIDRGGRLEQGNRAFRQLVGAAGAIAPRPWTELLPAEWRPDVAAALADPGRREIEIRYQGQALAVTAFPMDAGRHLLLFEDRTERQRLQDRLVQTEKLSAIGQLIAGIAHDLNNPLTSVVGFADFLAESADVPPRISEPLRVIQQEAERASAIVKGLLSFARRQETRQVGPLAPTLEATAALLRNQLGTDGIQLRVTVDPNLPLLEFNANQIQQVFVNLIQNAAQAIAGAGRPGTIRIHARRWMDGIAIEVADDGPGMTPEVAARIFEPFFTTKPEGQGTGLGLSISQGIVKEHGGRMGLTTAPGEGATLTVELPGRHPAAQPAAPTGADLPAHPLRVLVIDDEPHILHYVRATLESWGQQVTTAQDGHQGLALALEHPFDLIICDLRMPRTGGREFYQALTEQAPEVARRVAFSTGDTVREGTFEFLEAQRRPCLQKPFSLAELRALLADTARQAPA